MKVHLLSFSIGLPKNDKIISRFEKSARDSKLFDSCYVVKNIADPMFVELYKFLGSDYFSSRGFGFWAWKPYIISNYIKKISKDDVLVYADIGCEFSKNGYGRLCSYIKMLSFQHILAYSTCNSYPEYCWTKASVIKSIKPNRRHLLTEQIAATVVFFDNSDYSHKFLADWNHYCCERKGYLLDDNLSATEHKNFIENRHDQSIFSLLYKIRHLRAINRRTWFPEDCYRSENVSWLEPIHHLRNKTAYPMINNQLDISSGKVFLFFFYIKIRIFWFIKRIS